MYSHVPVPLEEIESSHSVYINETKPLSEMRQKRDLMLKETDKYTIPDWPHPTPEKKQEWLDYRQALRDLPTVTEDPANPVWPVPPE